jgi:hypothetical protein
MKKIYIYTLSTLLLWGAASCKKPNDFGTTNVDPTAVTAPVISALIASVEHNLPNYISTSVYAINGAAYAQYVSETQYPGTSLYVLPQVDFAGQYSGNLYDCQNVINVSTDKNAVAAATIMQQYIFWVLTDNFGDLPYSQALQGIKAITPVYDKQEDIYKGILSKTAAAVASLGGGSVPGDVVYGGDVAAWKRFGNSLIILASIQLSKVSSASAYASAAFKTAVAGGYIAENAQNFSVPYTADYHNPWFALYDGRYDWAQSKTMTDMTTGLNDGRQVPFGGAYNDPNKAAGGTVSSIDGVPYGLGRTDANNYVNANPDWSYVMRADKRTATSSLTVTSAAEVTLAVAEGISLGWATADASGRNATETYKAGITQSFAQWGLAAPSAAYLAQAGVAFNAKNLAIQQWIAAYPDGHLGWNTWRKTGYPALLPAPAASNSSGKIVRRLTYTSAEQQTNGPNVRAAVAREVGYAPGTDSQDNAVWWDVIGQALHP